MNADARYFDRSSTDASVPVHPGAWTSFDATADDLADVGYEAADPCLQAPLWREAMGVGLTPEMLR